MGLHIVVRALQADVALCKRVIAALRGAGHRVEVGAPGMVPAGGRPDLYLVLWTRRAVADDALGSWAGRIEANLLLELAVAVQPPDLGRTRVHAPVTWRTADEDPRSLLRAVRDAAGADATPGGDETGSSHGYKGFDPDDDAAGADAAEAGAFHEDEVPRAPASTPAPPFVPARTGSGPPPVRPGWTHAKPPSPPDEPPAAGAEPPEGPSAGSEPPAPSGAAPTADAPPAPVLLAASAPRQCEAGGSFTASLAVYVEAARTSALRRLEQLGEVGDRVVDDVAPDGDARWRIGAPVTVRVAGPHLKATPAERNFEWNGRENVAAFSVEIDAAAPAGRLQLCFQVDLAGLPMAYIPMSMTIHAAPANTAAPAAAAAAPAAPPAQAQATLPRSVFASYASKDAALVTQRLSTLARWDPGLDIFEDCLDLEPNAEFSAQLEQQIRTRDTFALFWSRNAAASKWVRWEYELRLKARGIESIVPMPLEDPAIVPPPTEFADTHWRDRFMLAGYALAAIREQVPPPAPVAPPAAG